MLHVSHHHDPNRDIFDLGAPEYDLSNVQYRSAFRLFLFRQEHRRRDREAAGRLYRIRAFAVRCVAGLLGKSQQETGRPFEIAPDWSFLPWSGKRTTATFSGHLTDSSAQSTNTRKRNRRRALGPQGTAVVSIARSRV